MKRKYVILVGILCVSLFAACGKRGEENMGGTQDTQDVQETQDAQNAQDVQETQDAQNAQDVQETQDAQNAQDTQDTQDTETDLLKKMEAANRGETLLQKYEKAAFISTYTYADGEVFSQYNYADSQRSVMENDYYIVIDEQGDVYGFDNEEKIFYHALFTDGSYEPYIQTYLLNLPGYEIEEKETTVNQEEKDGIIELSTSIVDKSYVEEVATAYWYEDGTVESLAYEYEIDAESYEIIRLYLYAVLPDGERAELYACERVADPETYLVDEQIHSAVFEGDMRTVTLTENPGTKQEKVYTQTVSKGNDIQVCLPPDHSGELYLDAACTTRYEGGADRNEDLDMYYIN